MGRCSSYGAGSLAPLHEIAAALGEPDALVNAWATEVPSAFRRLCERAKRPLLLDPQAPDARRQSRAVAQLGDETAPNDVEGQRAVESDSIERKRAIAPKHESRRTSVDLDRIVE